MPEEVVGPSRRYADSIKAEALEEAAAAWLQGEWAETEWPKENDIAAQRIGCSQLFGEWLRRRAETLREG